MLLSFLQRSLYQWQILKWSLGYCNPEHSWYLKHLVGEWATRIKRQVSRALIFNFIRPHGGSVALQISHGAELFKFVVTGDGSRASLIRPSAGALACIQDDGCFTLVCDDSSLCLCLTKCQQVSYKKIWQESCRVWSCVLQLPYCVADLQSSLSHCHPSLSYFAFYRQTCVFIVS